MNSNNSNSNWREDLEHSRDLSKREIEYIGFAVNWFESWRLAKNLELCRDVVAYNGSAARDGLILDSKWC